MNGPNNSTPLKHLPPFLVSLPLHCREGVGFRTQSVESGCGLENLTTSLPENLPSQRFFYPTREGEREVYRGVSPLSPILGSKFDPQQRFRANVG